MGGLALALALFALALIPAAAAATPATPTYVPGEGFAAPAAPNGQYPVRVQVGIAVEPVTGNVLTADPAESKVLVYAPKPELGTLLTSIDTGAGAPHGIAIDQANGDLYVSETGTDKIARYTSDGQPTPTYTLDPTFTSPVQGSGAGQVGSFDSAIAVDPLNHDLLVADSGNNRVSRYTAAGVFVGSFDGADTTAGVFAGLMSIAVGPTGTIYVADDSGNIIYEGGPGRVEQFSAAGVSQGALGPLNSPRSVAVDPNNGDVLVGGGSAYLSSPTPLLYHFSGGSSPDATVAYSSKFAESQPVALAVAQGSVGRVYGLTDHTFEIYSGTTGVEDFEPAVIPGVEVDPASQVGPTSVHLSGKVDPGGAQTSAHYEYALTGSGNWVSTPDQDLGAGSGEVSVEADPSGLRPNSGYEFRLNAANSVLSNNSAIGSFETLDSAPLISDETVGDLTGTSATLSAKVNPLGLQTTHHFEYGETTSYGQRVPAGNELAAGQSYEARAASLPISGLTLGVEYHFRMVATNAAGTSYGADESFATNAAQPPQRAYEMVSPINKQGVGPGVDPSLGTMTLTGTDGIMYATQKAVLPEGSQSAVLAPRVIATRTPDGWTNTPQDLPQSNTVAQFNLLHTTIAVSEDGRRSLGVSKVKLTPDAAEDTWNLYLREPATDPYSPDKLTLLDSDNYLYHFAEVGQNVYEVGVSGDARTFVYMGPDSAMYEVSAATGVRAVSELPDSTIVMSSNSGHVHDTHMVSRDGSRIFFVDYSLFTNNGLYVRENGTTTVPISVSHRPGDPATPVRGEFLTASSDGRWVVFKSFSPLTPDAPSTGGVYRYDIDTDTMTFVGPASEGGTFMGGNPSHGGIFEEVGAGTSINYIHDGVTTPVATFTQEQAVTNYQSSANGRYLAFRSFAPLTSFDPYGGHTCHVLRNLDGTRPSSNCMEVYLYDAQTETLVCVSCRSDAELPSGDANFGQSSLGGSSEFNGHETRSVLDDGTVFLDTPDPLVRGDANGTRDVYSYKQGHYTLITPGTREYNAVFYDTTPDGSDVYFVTSQRLVGQDQDTTVDLYDARIGGGIASQNPPPPVECLRDDCKATPNAGPELPFGGSEGLSGPENVKPPVHRHCGKGRRLKKVNGKLRCIKPSKQRANTNRRHAR